MAVSNDNQRPIEPTISPRARKPPANGKSIFVDQPGIDAFLKRTFPGGQVDSHLSDPFKQETRIYSAVSFIADAASSVPIQIFDGDPIKEPDRVSPIPDTDPVAKLFNHANPIMDPGELRERMTLGMELTGGAFWVMTDAQGNDVSTNEANSLNGEIDLPEEFWPMSQTAVEPVIDKLTGMPTAWRVNMGGGRTREYNASSLLQFKYPKPHGGILGMAPLEVAMLRAEQIRKAVVYQDSILENGGDPGGIIIAKDMGRDAANRLNQTIDEGWNDGAMAGDTRVLHGDLQYHPNPIGPKDMDFKNLTEVNWQAISEVFRVPPTLLGMRSANYAEHKLHLREFWTIKMLALFRRYEFAFNSRFFPRLKDPRFKNYRAKFDTSLIEALQGELLDQAKAAKELRDLGIPVNQALRLAGIDTDPVANGDEPMVPRALQSLELAVNEKAQQPASTPQEENEDPSAPDGPEPEDEEPEEGKQVKSTGELEESAPRNEGESREAYLRLREIEKTTEARRASGTKRIRAKVRKWGRSHRSAQLKNLDAIASGRKRLPKNSKKSRGPMSMRAAKAFIDAHDCGAIAMWRSRNPRLSDKHADDSKLLDLAYQVKTSVSTEELEAIILAFAAAEFWESAFIDSLGTSFDITYTESALAISSELSIAPIQAASEEALAFIRSKEFQVAEGVNSTLAKQLKSKYLQIFAESDVASTASIAEKLRAVLEETKDATRVAFRSLDSRAKTIAITETGQIDSHVRFKHMIKAGVERHQWVNSGLPNVRHSHINLDGQIRRLDESFETLEHGPIRRAHDPNAHPAEIINCVCVMHPVTDE